MTSGQPQLTWSVDLPERGRLVRGRRARAATLRVESDSHGSEELPVPVAVGRRLRKAAESGELCVASRAELLDAVRELSLSCGRARIEALVNRRDYSVAELTRRLCDEGYSGTVTQELVGRAREAGLVDDARFAQAFARSKALSGWGRLKIERELSRRGIAPEDVEGWPDELLPGDEELETARRLASRRRLTGRNDYEKIVRHLMGRGFPLAVATRAAKEATGRG